MTDVQLYIYDLSNGLARQMSLGLLGKQIDAIYHTSIVIEGVEYVYDGGIRTVSAGKTHLGPPLKIEILGKTELPKDVILEFLESLKERYTQQAYDIWTNNCNHFSNDFATFLVGRGIPEYISNLPQDVLTTPFGQMMKPHIDRMARQAQVNKGGLLGIQDTKNNLVSAPAVPVVKVSSQIQLDSFLDESKNSYVVIFFTSRNCRPCQALYPTYQEIAARVGKKIKFIMVDITSCQDVGINYSITATPTFVIFFKRKLEKRWTSSNPAVLNQNIDSVLRIAPSPHSHASLDLPVFFSAGTQPILFTKPPPLDNLTKKLGSFAEDSSLRAVLKFVSALVEDGKSEVSLSTFDSFSKFLSDAPQNLPNELLFIVVDLFRISMTDRNFSGYLAEERTHKSVPHIISHVNSLTTCPYSLRLVSLHLACNLFISPQFHSYILGDPSLTQPIVQLITSSLLDEDHLPVRVAAASLAFNITTTNRKYRAENDQDLLPEVEQVELAASILEAITLEEKSAESLNGLLLALANLIFLAPETGVLGDLLKSLDADKNVLSKKHLFPNISLIEEVSKIIVSQESK